MHGIGNDYVYFNCLTKGINNPKELAIKLSSRHFSIGGDGIILIEKSNVAHAKMRIFNLDGSEGKMCGNGIRCVAKWLFDNKKVTGKRIKIQTLSGVKNLWIEQEENGRATLVTADMGGANFQKSSIPVLLDGEEIVGREVDFGGENVKITCVSIGNPHCVIFFMPKDDKSFENLGRGISTSPIFPEGTNVEFVKIVDRNTVFMRVYERGSGETLACGTGACAVVAAGVKLGLLSQDEKITVRLKGGELTITYRENQILMTGDAVLAFEGVVEI